MPARCSFRISAAWSPAVIGRPSLWPLARAWARPARVRSCKTSRSKAANTASMAAIARPAGVVRSSASVKETKPTPRCSSSCRVASRSVTDRPQRSRRQTSTTSISRRRAASISFSRASLRAAPELTSRTCKAIVQPRRAAYSRMARFCIASVCGSLVETRAYRPARNIFGRLCAWPKTCADFAFWEARFLSIWRFYPTMAAVDPFRPGRTIILRGSGPCEPGQGVSVVPRHPLGRVLFQLLGMPEQLREVIECIDIVELASVDQAHVQVPHLRSLPGLVKQRVLTMQNGLLQGSFCDVVVQGYAGFFKKKRQFLPVIE